MRRAVRNVLVVVGIAAIATTGSVATSSAGVTAPTDVASIQPAPGEKVGVAHAGDGDVRQSITNRAAAEHTIAFTSPATPAGSFTWLNDRVLQWNPKGFWPAHSNIIVTAGGAKTTFETGAAVVGVADIDAHTFTVSIDGQVVRQMPASMGKPRYPTPIGSFARWRSSHRRDGFADHRHPAQRPRGVQAHRRTTPCASRGAASTCTPLHGRWAHRAIRTSATVASISAPTTPPGITTPSASATRSSFSR